MIDRRNFLRGTAIAGGGLMLAGGGLMPRTASAQAARNVTVNGRDVKVVDIHAHGVFPQVDDAIKGTPFERNWPGFQTMSPRRLEQMDQRGIDVQVLSVNVYWWYAADQSLAEKIVEIHDNSLAEWCNQHPTRFAPLSSVALQFPELAAKQLEHAVRNLGAKGASVGGHVNGEVPYGEKYDPFWAKAEELGVPVFVHPASAENIIQENAWEGRGDIGNIIGNPLETTYFLARLIYEGTLDRFPNLKVVGAHSGGYLPSYLGRFEAACEYRNNAECLNKKNPSEYLKTQIMADSMIFSEEGIRHLVAEMGAGQICYGSDLPFNWPDTIDIIANSPNLTDAQKTDILGGNLVKMLKLA